MQNNYKKKIKEIYQRRQTAHNELLACDIALDKVLVALIQANEKAEKKFRVIPKGKNHPAHDKCEDCFDLGREEERERILKNPTIHEFLRATPIWFEEMQDKDENCVMCGIIPSKQKEVVDAILQTLTTK